MRTTALCCRGAGYLLTGVNAVTMEGLAGAPPYPQFRHVSDKLLKAPDNSSHSSTKPDPKQIGLVGAVCVMGFVGFACIHGRYLSFLTCTSWLLPVKVITLEMKNYQSISAVGSEASGVMVIDVGACGKSGRVARYLGTCGWGCQEILRFGSTYVRS